MTIGQSSHTDRHQLQDSVTTTTSAMDFLNISNLSQMSDMSGIARNAGMMYSLPPAQPLENRDQPRGRKRPHPDRPVSASVARRNERERNRVKQVNQGFEHLRQRIPGAASSRKMSKVDTLRAAVDYIGQLQQLLRLTETDAATRESGTVAFGDLEHSAAVLEQIPAVTDQNSAVSVQTSAWCQLEEVGELLSRDSGCGSDSSGSPTYCYSGSPPACRISPGSSPQAVLSPHTLDFSAWLH